jgi:PPOX class probable F420-dependent enzyme
MQGHEEREQFLTQGHVAVFATIGPGKRPHAMPVWYLYEDGILIMLTGRGSHKHRNIERHQEVTLVVDRREVPYYAVMIQGTATPGPAPSPEQRLRLATGYLGEERGAAYTAQRLGADTVTIHLRPEKYVEYRGVAGHTPAEGADR